MNSALALLGQELTNHKTLFMGSNCKSNFYEVIPIKSTNIVADNIDVRMDYAHNEEVLNYILQRNSVEVTTTKPINENLVRSKKIKKIIYKAESFDVEFLNLVKEVGVPIITICTSSKNLPEERSKNFDQLINYLDTQAIIENNKKKINVDDFNTIKIKSNKKIVCGDDIYPSYFDLNERKNLDHFYLDLEFFRVYHDPHEQE